MIPHVTVTECPTCGGDVTIGREGEIHLFIPLKGFDPYVYKAEIISVFDGDTCTAIVDLGMNVSVRVKLRLNSINAPEVRGADKLGGIKSRDYLRSLILNRDVIIKTYKDKTEKYGRWLADIWVDNIFVNESMVESGHAVRYSD